ncbi:MAG: hypothetical protein M1812_006739 [Candelaria pacifica]|nr:MAG: hypothetical protein M1812_006739 [Candelaria pacifica]
MATSPPPMIKTTFLILSDTHNFEFTSHPTSPFRPSFPQKIDILLHSGDLTQVGGLTSFKKALKMLSTIPTELKLVIAGNHDLELDSRCWSEHLDGGDVVEDSDMCKAIMKGKIAEEAGVVYLEEGIYEFELESGARVSVYASPFSPACGDWAFAYERDEDRFNHKEQVKKGKISIAEVPVPRFGDVDVVLTHTPPKGILDECEQGNVGCENLLNALRRARPRLHCFGHIHEGYGAEIVDWENGEGGEERRRIEDGGGEVVDIEVVKGRQTLCVNAAVMNERNEPVNKPWFVRLDLPCR